MSLEVSAFLHEIEAEMEILNKLKGNLMDNIGLKIENGFGRYYL
jgi:hypothetical protein